MKAEIGKVYQHYKNKKQYTVLAIAHHTETGEKLVIYQAHYDTDDLGPKPIFARPKDMWEGAEEYEGQIVERFLKTKFRNPQEQ